MPALVLAALLSAPAFAQSNGEVVMDGVDKILDGTDLIQHTTLESGELAQDAAMAPQELLTDGSAALDLSDLNEISGGDSTTYNMALSNQALNATTSHNNIGGDVLSGAITLEAGALDDFTGIGSFVMNTGAQANLQSGITVNIAGAASPLP